MVKARQTRVLRIGIIQDGKIVQERLIGAGETVSVGTAGKATFQLPPGLLPVPEFALFERTAGGYKLRFTSAMRGKISTDGGVAALQRLIEDPSVVSSNGVFILPLSDRNRGKLTLGPVTILFQFVTPPPTQAVRSIQEMDFRPRLLESDDPALLGFLGVWAGLAAVLLFWVGMSETPDFTMEEIPDRFTKIVMEKEVVEVPETEADLTDGMDAPSEEEVAEPETEVETEEVEAEPETEVDEAARKEELKQEVMEQSKLLLKLIGTTGEGQGAPAEFFGSDGGSGDLDAKIAATSGVTTDSSQATRGGTDTEIGATDIGDLQRGGGGTAEVGGGPEVRVAEVRAEAGSMDELIGDENSVRKVVKRYAGQLKYCYERRLKEVPSLAGRVEVGWFVSGGAVEGLTIVLNTTRDDELGDCIKNKIRRWQFPEDVEGDVSWPFVFKASVQ
jgi:hypothetical protein